MKKLLVILLTLFTLSASAQTTDTVRIKVHGGSGGGISESKIAQMISDSLATLDLSGYTKEQVDSITTVIRSEIASSGITQTQLDDSTSAIREDIPDTSTFIKKGTYFPLNLIAPLVPADSFTARLDSLNLPPLRYSLTNRKIDTDTSLTDKKYVDSAIAAQPSGTSEIKQAATSGTSVTINNSTTWLIVNPSATLSAFNITLPATPTDMQRIEINFGGTVTSGTVVTTLTVNPNTGQGVIGTTSFSNIVVTDKITFRYNSTNSKWYE